MNITVRARCPLAAPSLHRLLPTSSTPAQTRLSSSSSQSPSLSTLLSTPTWSVRSLLPPSSPSPSSSPKITPQTLRHLLRLSALPPPGSAAAEAGLLATLEAQLGFVRAVRGVDVGAAVRPMSAVRDETARGAAGRAVGVAELAGALAREVVVGHARRPRRRGSRSRSGAEEGQQVKGTGNGKGEEENWDVLGGAGETAGRYFVVRTGGGGEGGGSGRDSGDGGDGADSCQTKQPRLN